MSRLCGKVLGHHRVGRMIGAGGMGEVYEAEDLQLGRQVALKVLPAAIAADEERLIRFTREARILASLNHPSIVTIYSVDQHEGEHFITMELVEGRTLAACTPPQGLPVARLLDVAQPLADALAAAHERGIVHRDLKPSNVMLTPDGRVKVLDFGLAKADPRPGDRTTIDLTADGALIGTLRYMSPEQFAGASTDARSDVFSLGVILYELAAGRHPYTAPGASLTEIVTAMQRVPTSLAVLAPALPAELTRVIARCLAKDPRVRPSSSMEVRAALDAIRRGLGSSDRNPLDADVPAVPSAAVLPFADMSPTGDQEYFCDGIAEEIISALAQLDGLRVAARTSSFAFKGKPEDVREIGHRLGVGAVLEGSVRKAGDRLRITVQLINVADGYHLWSQRFDRSADDIFAVQDEIALGVVEKLKVKLLAGGSGLPARRHVPTQEAYHHYLKGRYFLNRRGDSDIQRAIAQFDQAIAADPAYALPHIGIAETFGVLGMWGFLPPAQAYGRVKASAKRAIELDDSLAEAHFSLASALLLNDWDWAGARAAFERGTGLQAAGGPGSLGLGLLYVIDGRPLDAVDAVLRTVERNPLSSIACTQAAALHLGVGEFDTASTLLEQALELDPGMPMAVFWLGFCRGVQGRLEESVESLREAGSKGLSAALMYLTAALVKANRLEEAHAAAAQLERIAAERYVSPATRAIAQAAVGQTERALALLSDAEAERSPMLTVCLIYPGLLALATDWVQQWFRDRRQHLLPASWQPSLEREPQETRTLR